MAQEDEYFSNLTNRERAIFEGGISMGALFHQFVGTPVSVDTTSSLEEAIKNSILLQPAIKDVSVSINKSMIEEMVGTFGYTSLTGDMLNVEIVTVVNDSEITVCLSYIDKLNYPLMYVKD